MPRIAYFDCFSGASGDMILGALLDAGLDFDALRAEVAQACAARWRLHARGARCSAPGFAATKLDVIVQEPPRHRIAGEVLDIVRRSPLPEADQRARRARLPGASARPRRRCTARRSKTSSCTKSAPSTRSSTSPAPSPACGCWASRTCTSRRCRWAAARCAARTACCPCPRPRRSS